MTHRNPKIDAHIENAPRWRNEMKALREVLLDCGLTEQLKWGEPCFTAAGRNIAIMQPFKPHLALMFFKGALLDDPAGALRSQGPNTQSAMRLEFTSAEQVAELESTVRSLVEEAVAVEEAGLEVPKKPVSDYEVPDEFEKRLAEDEEYREGFEALTPGRRKSYLLHFGAARQSKTRERRIERCRPKIMEGKGLNER
jgi:uncharacterized protein YdeI (YjbR/CyaY-like superfamily)